MYWRKEELSDLKKGQSLEIFSSKIILSKEKRGLKSDFFFIINKKSQNLAFFLFVTSMIYAVIEFKPLGLVRDVGIMFFGFVLAYLAVAGGAKI